MDNNKFQNKYRIHSARAVWHDYSGGAYFVTVCTKNHARYFGEIIHCRDAACHISTTAEQCEPQLQLTPVGQFLAEQIANISAHYPYAGIPLFTVMPNHFHVIAFIDSEKIPYQRRNTERLGMFANDIVETRRATSLQSPQCATSLQSPQCAASLHSTKIHYLCTLNSNRYLGCKNSKKMKQIIAITFVTGFLFGQTFAQEAPTDDFLTQIRNYDLSTILTADSILADEENMIKRAEILGFIGDNYQRLQIHFISIIQNPSNRYEYFAYGKTKVRETVCTFQGTIKITGARLYSENDFPTYKQGFVECEVNLYEDGKQPSTGFFSGKLRTGFLTDAKGGFRYDAILAVADGFCNNQFVGKWTSYKTNATKKCRWGDYRIPESGDLDIGAGEFSVNDRYVKNGWENYMLLLGRYDDDTPEIKKARQKEQEQWWK
ncbi:MAG: hypothetical protein LBV47_00110 [Bacteroidales bacterium]|jgi:REP element-mobilizing transposase RayT|nr:hypothetical protein [Bacteroidales bacterium]